MDPLSSIHDLRQRPGRFDGCNVLRSWSPELISHRISPGSSCSLQFFVVVWSQVWSSNDTCKAHSTESKEVIVKMPGFLENSVMQIHTGLSVVRTCGNMHCSTKARRVTLEFSNIHLRQVTERLITQQDLCAGVTAFEPRGTFGCGLAVDEAWL